MRVAVDGIALQESRGIGNYLRHELTQFVHHPGVDVHVLAPPGVSAPEGVVVHHLRRRLTGSRFAHAEHDLRIPGDLAAVDPDVIWSPAQHPLWRSPVPWVQTLHDLIPLVVDHPALRRGRRRWQRSARRLHRAAAIVAVSSSTAAQAATLLGLDAGRIEVVHHGLDTHFRPPPADRLRPDIGAEPHLLMVAPWAPYKGYPEAMAVVAGLAEAGFPHELRIVGRNDAWMNVQGEAQRRASPRPDRVRIVGSVDDLRAAYWDADVVIVTSRHEGFGLPLLEAMGCGAAVVAFDNTSLPEVAGDGAVLVPDGDIDAMVGAVADLLRDDSARADVGRRGVARASTFTWEASAAALADVLRAAAAQGSPTA